MSMAYDGRVGAADVSRTLFAHVMWYVAGAAGVFALGVFGIVLIFVSIPGGALVDSILGLVILAALTAFGRRSD